MPDQVITTKQITDYRNHDGEVCEGIMSISKYANGNHIVFDLRGKQIPDLQAHEMYDEAKRLAGDYTVVNESAVWPRL
jgi:hypothetical protein